MPLFPPPSNVTGFPCYELEQIELSRPARSGKYFDLNVTLLATFLTLVAFMTLVLWRYRNEPRFHTIRPFPVSLFSILTITFMCLASTLPEAFPGIPCAFIFSLHSAGVSGCGMTQVVRALTMLIESRCAFLTLEYNNNKVGDGGNLLFLADDKSAVSTQVTIYHDGSFFSLLFKVLKLGFGVIELEDLDLTLLAKIRQVYTRIFITMFAFTQVATVTSILIFSPYRDGCKDCQIYLVVVLTVIFSVLFCTFLILRFTYLGFKYENDQQGVRSELYIMILLCVPPISLGYFLILIDPNDLNFQRIFPWSFFVVFGCYSFIFTSCAIQTFKAFQFKHKQQASKNTLVPDYYNFSSENPHVKEEFTKYAAGRYCMENLNFLDDLSSFKSYFFDKSETWRVSKVKFLMNTYVNLGSPQEVNVSDHARQQSILLGERNKHNQDGFHIFDKVFEEVKQMVQLGPWADFYHFEFLESQKKSNSSSARRFTSKQVINSSIVVTNSNSSS